MKNQVNTIMYGESAIVLDIPYEKTTQENKHVQVIQAICKYPLILLELIFEGEEEFYVYDEININSNKRLNAKIIDFDMLTEEAKKELKTVVYALIKSNGKRIMDLFYSKNTNFGKESYWLIFDEIKKQIMRDVKGGIGWTLDFFSECFKEFNKDLTKQHDLHNEIIEENNLSKEFKEIIKQYGIGKKKQRFKHSKFSDFILPDELFSDSLKDKLKKAGVGSLRDFD